MTTETVTPGRKMVRVIFTKPYGRYKEGDVATFTEATANDYVRIRAARPHAGPVQKVAAASPKKRTAADVLERYKQRGERGAVPGQKDRQEKSPNRDNPSKRVEK